MSLAGTEICFEVFKGAAYRNGLDSWLRGDLNNDRLTQKDSTSSGESPLNINGNPTNYPTFNSGINHNRSISASELYSQVLVFTFKFIFDFFI